MTALLTDNLSLLAGAPNGIKKLRELILELAVRGKLVPQDPNDEPASELLKQIAEERARQVSEGRIKKQKELSGIADLDKPFPLPKGWEWLRLGDLTLTILSGGTPSKNVPEYWGGHIPWASVKDLNVYRDLVTTQDYITEEGLAAGSKLANKGEVLICTRMGLGKIAVAAMDVAINQDLKALRLTCHLNLDYFLNFYRTLSIVGSGMTVAGIKQDELLSFLVPMPPLAEQHRIVAKVDELMALCDRLEAQQADTDSAHAQLVQALLGSLTQARDAEDFAQSWQRLAEHFHSLFTTESSIDALKQTLLQLAVMGKLTSQDNTQLAGELISEISMEKQRLISVGVLKKSKHSSEIPEDERPFFIPKTWVWVRLADIATVVDPNPSHRMPKYVEKGIPFISTENFSDNDGIDFGVGKKVEASTLEDQASKFEIRDGAFAISRIGTIGKTRPLPTERNYCLSHALCVISPYLNVFSSLYLRLAVTAENVLMHAHSGVKSIGVPDLGVGTIRSMPIPVPPRAEQDLIVAKVDQLMSLCDQLKARLNQARQMHEQLASALVEQAVA